MELRLRLSALATPNTCPMHTESDDAQYEDRECADIQRCVVKRARNGAAANLVSNSAGRPPASEVGRASGPVPPQAPSPRRSGPHTRLQIRRENQMTVDARHRDKNGEISRKHGNG
jgi:hypothetical protein